MNKRLIALLLTCLLAGLSLAACHGKTGPGDATGTGSTGTQTGETSGESSGTVRLFTNGASDYAIVEGTGIAPASRGEVAQDIQSKIRMQTGVELPIVSAADMTQDGLYIVIGRTERFADDTQEILDGWGYGQYGYRTVQGCVLILGQQDFLTEMAAERFGRNVFLGEDPANLEIPAVWEGNYNDWLTDVPHPSAGAPESIYDCGDQTFLLFYRNAGEDAFDAYLTDLQGSNYSLAQQSELGSNRYATYRSEAGEIVLNYAGSSNTLRITCQAYGEVTEPAPLAPQTMGETVTQPELAVMSLNYAGAGIDPTDGNGLSLVLTLEDGRFVIIDGGYSADAHGLYNYLTDRNQRQDGVVIAAWILTHGHGDHIGCFETFTQEYGDRVTCQALISNALPASVHMISESNSGALTNMLAYANRFAEPPVYIKPHAGQTIYIGNMAMEMLLTHEDFYPSAPSYLNETSLVFRLRLGGQTILITADAELRAVSLLNALYGSNLKSDVFQINHHGYSDIPETFFENVNASIALWPTSQTTADLRNKSTWRNGIYLRLTQSVDEWYAADGEVEILILPYRAGGPQESYTMDFEKR